MDIYQFSTVFSNVSVHQNPPEGLFKDELLGSILILTLTLILVWGLGQEFSLPTSCQAFLLLLVQG